MIPKSAKLNIWTSSTSRASHHPLQTLVVVLLALLPGLALLPATLRQAHEGEAAGLDGGLQGQVPDARMQHRDFAHVAVAGGLVPGAQLADDVTIAAAVDFETSIDLRAAGAFQCIPLLFLVSFDLLLWRFRGGWGCCC